MKIRLTYPDEKDLKAVEARAHEIGDAHDIPRLEVRRQALLAWIHSWGMNERTIEVSEEEWRQLLPVLDRLRRGPNAV